MSEVIKKTVDVITATKINWNTQQVNNNGYPGDDNMKIGCLQRIADATEAMAKNYVQLMADRDLYNRWYEQQKAEAQRLERSNRSLRGYITRMKKAKK